MAYMLWKMSEEQKEELKKLFAEHGINIDVEMAMIEEVDDNDEWGQIYIVIATRRT